MSARSRSEIDDRIERVLRRRPSGFRSVEGGYTPAQRWLVDFTSGPSVFVKIGTSAQTAGAHPRD
jgi:ribosomal protein L21E